MTRSWSWPKSINPRDIDTFIVPEARSIWTVNTATYVQMAWCGLVSWRTNVIVAESIVEHIGQLNTGSRLVKGYCSRIQRLITQKSLRFALIKSAQTKFVCLRGFSLFRTWSGYTLRLYRNTSETLCTWKPGYYLIYNSPVAQSPDTHLTAIYRKCMNIHAENRT